MELIADVLNEMVNFLGIGRFFLAGHSLGGYAALAYAELFPKLLSGYCLFHSHPFADSDEALKKREREIKFIRAGKKDLMYPDNVSRMFADSNLQKFSDALQRSKEIASSISGEGIIAILRGMMARPSRINILESGRVPCLWILGTMDNYIDYMQVQKNVKLPVNAKVVILKDSGHIGFIEEEDKSVDVITSFVEKLESH